jgi:murein DD-endopeptidase MepM/ murein hydrolase activator NlpD
MRVVRAARIAPVGIALALITTLAGCSSGQDGGDSLAGSSPASAPAASAPGSGSVPSPGPAAEASGAASTVAGSSPSTRRSPGPTPARVDAGYAFPVRSAKAMFGRYHHDYPATDIFAPCGTRVAAPASGRISEVSRTDTWSSRTDDGAVRGGLSVSMVGTDGVRYYGSHLRSIPRRIRPGARVATGDTLGHVGNTGDATGISCHLHFGISPPCGTGDWWIRRGVISPYRFLVAWRAGREESPAAAVAAWRAGHGCPKAP